MVAPPVQVEVVAAARAVAEPQGRQAAAAAAERRRAEGSAAKVRGILEDTRQVTMAVAGR
jgi:hypothetical protein